MKILKAAFIILTVTSGAMTTTEASVAETKEKNHKLIVEKIVPKEFSPNEMEMKVLEKGAVDLALYNSPRYMKEHEQAYKWLHELYERKELMAYAHKYQTEAKACKPIEHLHEKVGKKANKFLGTLLSHVAPPELQWSTALSNYKRAIDICKNNPNRCAIAEYKKWYIRGDLARNMNCIIANMGTSYVAVIEPFVQEKMELFEEASPSKIQQ